MTHQLRGFLGEDPIGFVSEDFNFYRYVSNDPVNRVDPSGMWCISLGKETRNPVEKSIGAPWWKVNAIQKFGKTGILMDTDTGICGSGNNNLYYSHLKQESACPVNHA